MEKVGHNSVSQPVRPYLRQGSVIPVSKTFALITHSVDKKPEFRVGSRIVVVSQDCDIAHSEEKEPFVELIVAHPAQSSNHVIQNRRNPRKLQISAAGDAPFFELNVNERFRAPKSVLLDEESKAVEVLPEDSLRVMRIWLADRYKRPAFPDEFNNRLGKQRKALDKYYQGHQAVSNIFISTSEEELPPGKHYDAKIILAYEADLLPENIFSVEGDFEEILSLCGIDATVFARAEDDITISELRYYKRLALDYLSPEDAPSTPDVNEIG